MGLRRSGGGFAVAGVAAAGVFCLPLGGADAVGSATAVAGRSRWRIVDVAGPGLIPGSDATPNVRCCPAGLSKTKTKNRVGQCVPFKGKATFLSGVHRNIRGEK